jgi:hypothetical protein
MKTDLHDFTFLIPLRVDSIVRIENMLITIHNIFQYFNVNIILLQATAYENKIIPKLLDKRVKYLFVEDKDNVFYRTKYLNFMTKLSETPFVGIWDTDIIIPRNQVSEAVQKLRDGYEIAYPYDGNFYDTTDIIRELFLKKRDLRVLTRNIAKMKQIYGDQMKGGAMFVNKEAYTKAGMENENFYGWGPEDFERYERWKILEYKIFCSKGCLFHLSHSRGSNSTFRSTDQMLNSNKELFLTKECSKEELNFNK